MNIRPVTSSDHSILIFASRTSFSSELFSCNGRAVEPQGMAT